MFAISKRIFLFMLVNILVITTISLVWSILGQFVRLPQSGYEFLIFYCIMSGFVGAFVSLSLSRVFAKWTMGVHVIDLSVADPSSAELVRIVHTLAERAGLRHMPEVGIYESPEINAFATGPSKSRSLVAVSSGLLNRMSRDQIEAVLGHEIGHISNGDMVTMTLIQGVINSIVMIIARLLAMAIASQVEERNRFWTESILIFFLQIVLSLFGSLVVNYFSRRREFRADAWGARLAGRQKMIAALRALAGTERLLDNEHNSLATLKIYGADSKMLSMIFSTHPSLDQRIAALESAQ